MKKLAIIFFVLWIGAFGYNLQLALLYPDGTIMIGNLVVSIAYLGLVVFVFMYLIHKKEFKILKLIGLLGTISVIIIFLLGLINTGEFISLPLYIIFVTPLFGFNYLLDLDWEVFSILCSVVYLMIFLVQLLISRKYK